MQKTLQNLFNFVNDNLGKDSTIIGLCGVRAQKEYTYVNIPQSYKKAYIPNVERNYLFLS